MTIVREESMVVDTSVMAKSLDTRGMSDTAKMPFSSLAAALRKACPTPEPEKNESKVFIDDQTITELLAGVNAMVIGPAPSQIFLHPGQHEQRLLL